MTDFFDFFFLEIGTKNSCLLQRFHSGVYLNNCWSCCDEKTKNVPGCKKTYFFKGKMMEKLASFYCKVFFSMYTL